MPRKPDPRRIKSHRIYTCPEAAVALGVHEQTVRRWIMNGELPADRSQRPWLIEGADLKSMLEARRADGKCKTKPEEIYCLPCRRPQVPDGWMAEFQLRSATAGQLTGICPDCDRLLHRAVRRADLDTIRACLDVTIQQAQPRLVGENKPPVSAHLDEAGEDHVKKHLG